MLKKLHIQNFILIDDLEVLFEPGLTVITGETGAGKSILIDALTVLLGARASKSFIRTGQEKTVIQAQFHIHEPLLKILKLRHPELKWLSSLIIEKEIFQNGKSTARINELQVSLQVLKDVGDYLIDIHGQLEHQALFNSLKHVEMLDSFNTSANNLGEELERTVKAFHAIDQSISALNLDDEAVNREVELLNYQIKDIDAVMLTSADDALEEEYELIKDAETLTKSLVNITSILTGSDDQPGALSQLMSEHKQIKRFESLSEEMKLLSEQMTDLIYASEDFHIQVRRSLDNVQMDEERLYHLEQRINSINMLKRKYGHTVTQILAFRNQAQERLDLLSNLNQKRHALETEKAAVYNRFLEVGLRLTRHRRELAQHFEKDISNELQSLNMPTAVFVVDFTDLADSDGRYRVSNRGLEAVEFLVSFNPGEIVRPLKSIASGGEMSRVMLALKVLLARQDLIPTLVFDEVDTGISGKTASIVAEKLYQVSIGHQVLCISHLSQLALMGDHHYLISKETNGNLTQTKLVKLNEEARMDELSRMISGLHQTQSTKEHVKELLHNIANQKEQYKGRTD